MEERSPSAWLYLLGVLVWFGGCCGGVGNTIWSFGTSVQDQPRGEFPGELQMRVDSGRHVIFQETKSTLGDESHTSAAVSGLECDVQGPDGPIPVYPPAAHSTYSFSRFKGESVLGFDSPRSGAHTMTCTHDGADPVVLSVGTGLGGDIMVGVTGAVFSAFFGIGICVLVFALRRRGGPEGRRPQ